MRPKHMKHLHWAVVCVLFWGAWTLFRLGTAVDIQNLLWYLVGLPIGFSIPFIVGWNLAIWRCHHRTYHLSKEDDHESDTAA